MRRHFSLALVLAGVAVAAACSANIEQERNALLTLDREWSQTTKDINRFMTYYAPDATAYPPGMAKATGTQAIRAAMGPFLLTPGLSLKWTADKADVGAGGNLGYTSGTYTATMPNPAGTLSTEAGKYVAVWKKQAGNWRVVEDIFNADTPPNLSSPHVMVAGGALKWGDAPPGLPGIRMAILSGDPSKPEPFTIRAQLPAGYRLAPHWHPTDEHLTIVSGTFALGMGEKFDQAALKDLSATDYAVLPATMRHYAMAKGATTIQIHSVGPFAINYVNPADDSRTTR